MNWRRPPRKRASSTTPSFSGSWTRPWPGEPPRGPHPGAALPHVPHRAGAVLELLPELQPAAGMARHSARDRRRVRVLRVDGIGRVVVLSLVRAQHPGRGFQRGAAQGAEGIQIPRPLRLGLRRRRHVPDALLSLVRARAVVALRSLPERLPALRPAAFAALSGKCAKPIASPTSTGWISSGAALRRH